MGGIRVLRGEFGVGMEMKGVRLVPSEDRRMAYHLVEGRSGLEDIGVEKLDLVRPGSVGERLPLRRSRPIFCRVGLSLLHSLLDHQLA